ncbi:2OG-Fe(II) oxygenase [Streptomyces sp. RB17]|uniref:2OG-Fe(II) oxygenase n=1 Tax=Streptomyces sp. RB17 TaxID=2585197 RepID=UPI002B1F9060|nr:2OG-Fe(II) oxygenase [Streptomyces sp. RB17]
MAGALSRRRPGSLGAELVFLLQVMIARILRQGPGLVFTTRDHPVRSRPGWSADAMRHGVSTVRSGRRRTLGLVFHDVA